MENGHPRPPTPKAIGQSVKLDDSQELFKRGSASKRPGAQFLFQPSGPITISEAIGEMLTCLK